MISEIIQKRVSTRTFSAEYLTPSHKEELNSFIEQNCPGIKIIEISDSEKPIKLLYGAIKGNKTYALGVTKHSREERLWYGYNMQKLVLKATDMGVGSCWIGYFDHEYFKNHIPGKGTIIPGVVILGYAAEKRSTVEKLLRYTVRASKRMEWDALFFDFDTLQPVNPKIAGIYANALEMVRLSPSSSNSQPWRIFIDSDNQELHFFKKPKSTTYEKMGMHELDMGIAMCHFQLSMAESETPGEWQTIPGIKISGQPLLQYVISWTKKKTTQLQG